MAHFLSRLLPVAASAYGLQAGEFWELSEHALALISLHPAFAAVFVPQANERWYDLGGGLGFVLSNYMSLYYPSLKAKFWNKLPASTIPSVLDFAPRQILCTTLMTLWSARLGTFLFTVSSCFYRA